MKIQLFRGNPIIIVFVSLMFSAMLIVLSIVTVLRGQVFDVGIAMFAAYITFFNCSILIVFYVAYNQEVKKSKYAFMSPKKYKQSIKHGEQHYNTINRLKNSLSNIGVVIKQSDEEAIVDKVIEIIESKEIHRN